MKVGDIEKDEDGSEWVLTAVTGRDRVSRVRRNSIAHRIHAKGSEVLAESLEEDDGVTATSSEESA